MAKRRSRTVDLTLDEFNFDDGLNFPDFNFDPPPVTNKREAVERIAINAKDSFISNLSSPTFFQGLVRKALPKGFGQMLDLADQGAVTLRDLYNDGEKQVKPAIQDLARTTDRLMPSAEKYLPKKIVDKLKKFTANNRDQYTDTMHQMNSASAENLAVAGLLADVFKSNIETDARREAKRTVQEQIRDTMDQGRHEQNLSQLDEIRTSVFQMASYQRKIEFNYHRKSLELQARSYFVAMESLREQRRQNAFTSAHLTGILKNTALPDFVKMRVSDQFVQLTSNKFINSATSGLMGGAGSGVGGVAQGLFGRRAGFIGNLGQAARDQSKASITAGAQAMRDGLAGANQIVDQSQDGDGGVDRFAAGGLMIGNILSNVFRNKIAARFTNQTNNSNSGWAKKLRQFGNGAQYSAENAPQLIGEFSNSVTPAEEYSDNLVDGLNNRFGDKISDKWKRRISKVAGAVGNPALDFARGTIRRSQNVDLNVKETGLNNLHEPAAFSNQNSASINDVIPGLLSRILQEVHILRTGNPNADMIKYDYQKNSFSKAKDVKGSVFGRIVDKGAKEATDRDLEKVFDMIDPEKKLSAEQRRILGGRMMQDNMSGAVGRAGDLRRYSNTSQFNGSDEERAHAAQFAKLFKGLKKTDEDGSKQVKFGQLFSAIGQSHGDPRAYIQQLVSTGHRAELEEMGILSPGSTRINMDMVHKYQSGSQKYRAKSTRAGNPGNVLPLNNPLPPTLPHQEPALPIPALDPSVPTVRQGLDLTPLQEKIQGVRDIVEQQNTLPILGDIHLTLQAMQARLDEGILTVPMADVLDQLLRQRGGAGGPGGGPAGRRGIIRRLGGVMSMSLKDLVKGSFSLAGKGVRSAAWLGNKIVSNGFSAVGKIAGFAGSAAAGVGGGAYRRARGFVDIYVGNERRPRMYGRMLQEGNVYFDQATNKPIRKFSDITGTVIRRQAGQDTVVLEAEEIEHAYQREGAVKKTLKALGATVKGIKNVAEGVLGALTSRLPLVYQGALTLAKKAFGLLDMPQDVYVKGGPADPVLLARIMRKGGYRSATTGETITRPSQIDGPVLVSSADGDEVALSHDDIRKGLVDKNGQPLRTGLGKLANLIFGGAKKILGAAKWMGNKAFGAVKSLAKNAWGLTKGVAKAGVKTLGFGLDVLRGKPWFEGADELRFSAQIGQASHAVLEQIRDILDQRLPERKRKVNGDVDGDGIRDGSFIDLQNKERAKKERLALPGNGEAGVGGKGGMMASMKAMWDKMRGKKDEEEDEDDGDTNIDFGGDGDDERRPRNSKEARRKRRLSRMRNKGFWGKTKAFAKGAGKMAMGAGGALLGMGGVSLGAVAGAGGAVLSGIGAATGAVATGAGALAAGIGSIISLPVLLGAAAVAAVGIGGYYAYKHLTRHKLGLLSRVRYAQYGFSPGNDKYVNPVFELESKLRPTLIYGKEGATIDNKKLDVLKLLDLFDISKDDRREVENWANWFKDRFKPVFLTHATAMRAINGEKWLSDVDSLDAKTQQRYLELTKFPEGPYGVDTSPFKDLKSLPSKAGDVRMLISIVEDELKSRLKTTKGAEAGVAGAAAVAAKTAIDQNGPTQRKGTPTPGNAVAASGIAVGAIAAMKSESGLGATTKGTMVTVAGSNAVLDSLGTNRVDNLSAVRYRTYGLVKMEADKVRALRALEKVVGRGLQFNKKVASWNGSLEEVLKASASTFAIDITDSHHTEAWLAWFNQRFLPVFLNHATSVYAITGKEDMEVASSLLSPTQLVDVATAVYTTISRASGSSSVWTLAESPWPGYAINLDTKSVEGNMQSLKEVAKNAILPEPTSKSANQPTAKSAVAGAAAAQAAANNVGVKGRIGAAVDKIKDFFGSFGSGSSKEPGVGGGQAGSGSGASMPGDPGRMIDQPGKGTGGDINSIPLPKGNKSWAALKDTILAASQMAGVDPKLMAAMAAIESGFNYQAKAGTSSASGLYQFINGTWQWMMKRYGAKYGINPNTSQMDPRANALLGAEYIKQNVAHLQGALKRPLTDTDLYFAHFLGSGGAKKFLSADPNALGASILPDAARANKSIFFDKSGAPLTVAAIYKLVNERVQNKGKKFGVNIAGENMVEGSTPPAQTTPAAPAAKVGTAPGEPVTKSGIGAPAIPDAKVSASAPAATAAKPTSAPGTTASKADMVGFTALVGASSMRDVAQQAKHQQEMKVVGLEVTNETLSKSLGVQSKILDAMGELLTLARTSRSQQAASSPPGPKPTQQQAGRQQAPMRPSPISMAKPNEAY